MEPGRGGGGSINLKYTQMEEVRQHTYNTKKIQIQKETNTNTNEVHTIERSQREHTLKVKERLG